MNETCHQPKNGNPSHISKEDSPPSGEEHHLTLSPLGHTWLLDLDGTILKHNGYKLDGEDTFLDGALPWLLSLPEEDKIIFVTSRSKEEKITTESFLQAHGVDFHDIVYGLPYGERILVNDRKPSGLQTAFAVNLSRDSFVPLEIEIDEAL